MPLNSRRSLKSSLKFNLKSSLKFNLKSSLVHLISLEPDSETRWIGWDCRHFLPKWVADHYAFTCCFDIPGSECNWGGLISQRAPWSTIFAHDERTLCQKTQRLISNDEHDIYRKVWSLFLSLVFSLKGLWVFKMWRVYGLLKQNFMNSISNNERRTNTFPLLFLPFPTFPIFPSFPYNEHFSLTFPTFSYFSYFSFFSLQRTLFLLFLLNH